MRKAGSAGFTLIELMTALVILSLLGLMSYRGLGAVLDTREHVSKETAKWQALDGFFTRLERDVQRAASRPVRAGAPGMPALRGGRDMQGGILIELTRLGSVEDSEPPRRIAYSINALNEVELWLWPAIDRPYESQPKRYPLLKDVRRLELSYLAPDLEWRDAWPAARVERALPLALRVRLVLASGEELVRTFALT